jgi:hypothetical protein
MEITFNELKDLLQKEYARGYLDGSPQIIRECAPSASTNMTKGKIKPDCNKCKTIAYSDRCERCYQHSLLEPA